VLHGVGLSADGRRYVGSLRAWSLQAHLVQRGRLDHDPTGVEGPVIYHQKHNAGGYRRRKISMLAAVVMCRPAWTVPIVSRIKALGTMITTHWGGEIAASLRRIRPRLACSTSSIAATARL
jgi:hypothetical protein